MLVFKRLLIAAMLSLALFAAAQGQVYVQPGQVPYTPTVQPPEHESKLQHLLPVLDIKAGGEDANVLIHAGDNVRIDFSIAAKGYAGKSADVWVILETPTGLYTYDSIGPYLGWNRDLNHPYYSGPLADMKDVALDSPLPISSYKAYLAIDRKANGILDPGAYEFMDMVDFEVFLIVGFFEDFEDGIADGWAPDGPHWTVANGVYNLDCPSPGYFYSYYYPAEFGDFTYYAQLRMVDTGNVGDSLWRGLVFRTDGTPNNGYQAVMNNDGKVQLKLCVNSPIPMLLKSVQSTNVVQGAGSWNTLEVDARDSVISVYINGALEFSVDDLTFAGGWAGLIGECQSLYNADYEFDNVGLVQ